MNRLHIAQKQLAESLETLESAVKQAQNLNGHIDGSDVPTHPTTAIDIGQLSEDLAAIESDLEAAMKMIANLTLSGLSSSQDKDSV